MTDKRYFYSIVSAIYIFLLLLLSIHFWCFNEHFYQSEHDKLMLYGNSINDHIGISKQDLSDLTSFVLAYLNDPQASLDIQMNIKGIDREVFNSDEKLHMVDVRNLNLKVNNLIIILSICLLLAILIIFFRKPNFCYLYKSYKKIVFAVLLFFIVLGIWILIDFDSFWTLFHQIFFSGNELWILDLRKDILIMIVPPQFFNDLVVRIIVTYLLLISFSAILIYFAYRKSISYD